MLESTSYGCKRIEPREVPLKFCGMLMCFNEEHILAESLTHYLRQGLDLVVFDNESTDASPEIVAGLREQNGRYPGRIIDVVTVRTDGFEWVRLLSTLDAYMHDRLGHYDWLFLIDADSFYWSPVRGYSLTRLIADADARGYNVLDGLLYHFYPTDRDDPSLPGAVERIRYYNPFDKRFNPAHQHRIFRYHPSVDFVTGHGHTLKRKDIRVFPVRFHFRHYNWVSFEQGKRKVFAERKARYRPQELRHHHPPYNTILPRREDFVRDARKLKRYRDRAEQLSVWTYRAILASLKVYAKLERRHYRWKRFVFHNHDYATLLYDRERRQAYREYRRFKANDFERQERWSAKFPTRFTFDKSSPWSPVGLKAYVFQKVDDFDSSFSPCNFNFLVSGACNARCVFCNQLGFTTQYLSFADFERILGNIPAEAPRSFVFSGGGEPLLNRDLFKMIEHTNTHLPWVSIIIRSNGFSLSRRIESFAQHRVNALEISWHAASSKLDEAIFQRPGFDEKVESVEALLRALAESGRRTELRFCPVLSQLNLHELPDIIRLAAELGVAAVDSSLCKYYPKRDEQGNPRWSEDANNSLYYRPDAYAEAVRQARRLASDLGVRFSYDKPAGEPHKEVYCRAPWTTMLVNFDGTVFPCPGGEVQFSRGVAEGRYDFGNLLDSHLYECLGKVSYTQLRRTLAGRTSERFVPECSSCCMTASLQGADKEHAHLLRWP